MRETKIKVQKYIFNFAFVILSDFQFVPKKKTKFFVGYHAGEVGQKLAIYILLWFSLRMSELLPLRNRRVKREFTTPIYRPVLTPASIFILWTLFPLFLCYKFSLIHRMVWFFYSNQIILYFVLTQHCVRLFFLNYMFLTNIYS